MQAAGRKIRILQPFGLINGVNGLIGPFFPDGSHYIYIGCAGLLETRLLDA